MCRITEQSFISLRTVSIARVRQILRIGASLENQSYVSPKLNNQPQTSSSSEITRASSQWLTAQEAATYLKVAPRTLLLWARCGKVKGHVLSGTERQTRRFRESDLDAMLSTPSVA